MRIVSLLLLILFPACLMAQETSFVSFRTQDSIIVTIDQPVDGRKKKRTVVVFYALPNGNTTAQTMGKNLQPGDDWHFDIQHIRAQTAFLRQQVAAINWVVVYLENDYRSWPSWKLRHPAFRGRLPALVDSIVSLIPGRKKEIALNGHSGGGSFIFGYLAGVSQVPSRIKRISFLDSNYGYDSSYYPKLNSWLQSTKGAALNVFAYNDSVALYNGKPLVSATGGTWYRGHLMLRHFSQGRQFNPEQTDSLEIWRSQDQQIQFFFKKNRNRGIYHTQQVELNGFIHSLLCGTAYDSRGYHYYGKRAYQALIR